MRETRGLRYTVLVAVAATAVVVSSSCGVIGGAPEAETVVIGVDLEITGEGSSLGDVFQNALDLRVEQVNEQGLVGDRRLELLVTDNRSDPATAAENLRTLAADPSVRAIIAGACDECVLRAVEDLNGQGMPTVSLAPTAEVVQPVTERPYIFKLAPDASHNAALISREMRRADVETVALVGTTGSYGEEGLAEMTQAAGRADIDVPVTVTVPEGGEDLAAVAAQIAEYEPDPGLEFESPEQEGPAGPDAVAAWVPAPVAGALASALRQAGYEGTLYFDSFAADELFVAGEHARALEGAQMVFTETLVIDEAVAVSPAKAARQAWFRSYIAREGTYHAYSSFAADAVNVIVEAINRFDSTERDTIRDGLENTLLDGLTGPIRINVENHSGLSPQGLTTVVVRNDRWRLAA